MDAPLPPEASVAVAPYRDRSTLLAIFGAVEVVLGAMAFLFIPLLLLGVIMARKTGGGMPLGGYIQNAINYVLAGICLITLGIGTIRARRWAWALNVVLSWVWLVVGVVATAMITAILPQTFVAAMRTAAADSPSPQTLSRGIMAGVLTCLIALGAIFLVVVPFVFVVFFRKKDVEETCRRRDPVPRWTDRCPLPVLAASLIFAAGSARYFLMSFTLPLCPLFGRYLTGPPAALALLVFAAVDAALAYWLYRRHPLAWWTSMAILLLGLISAGLTFHRADLLRAYAKMGWSASQLRVMSATPALRSGLYLYWGLGFGLIFLAYMLWVKRYFTPATEPPQPAQAAQS